MIKFVKGDILKSKCDVLVNPVNCVGVMGAGLALQFKKKYPDMFKEYYRMCKNKLLNPCVIHWYDLRQDKMYCEFTPPNYIFNFPTKKHWKEPSRIEYIERGLDNLNELMWSFECESVAIPKLGCGLGNLLWENVKSIIIEKCIENYKYVIYE